MLSELPCDSGPWALACNCGDKQRSVLPKQLRRWGQVMRTNMRCQQHTPTVGEGNRGSVNGEQRKQCTATA